MLLTEIPLMLCVRNHSLGSSTVDLRNYSYALSPMQRQWVTHFSPRDAL